MTAANAPQPITSSEHERRFPEPSMEEILASIRKIIAEDDPSPTSRAYASPAYAAAQGKEPPSYLPFGRSMDLREPAPKAASVKGANTLSQQMRAAENASDHDDQGYDDYDAEYDEASPTYETADYETHPSVDVSSSAIHASHDRPSYHSDPHLEEMTKEAESLFTPPSTPDWNEAFNSANAANESASLGGDANPILSSSSKSSIAQSFQALSTSVALSNSEMIERNVKELLRPMLKQWLDDNLPVMVERLVRQEIERVARGS